MDHNFHLRLTQENYEQLLVIKHTLNLNSDEAVVTHALALIAIATEAINKNLQLALIHKESQEIVELIIVEK